MNIVIPMAGSGQRFKDAGYPEPKPLIDVLGKPMYERVLDNLNCEDAKFILITQEEHGIPSDIQLKEKTEGAACTVLLAWDYINNEEPLMIANCDQLLKWDINDFLRVANHPTLDYDACVVTFNSTNPHHSYVRVRHGKVVEVAEKKVISDKAIAGIYYFKHGKDFVEYACKMIIKNIRYNGEFYISPLFNELISAGKNLGIYEISVDDKHMLGTPEELHIFLDKVDEGDLDLSDFKAFK